MKPIALLALLLTGGTLFSHAAPSPVSLFNGKDLTGWNPSGGGGKEWRIGKAKLDESNPARLVVSGEGAELVATDKVANLTSEAKFADCLLEFEFMMAKNSNSGVKLMLIYEIQLLDSYGKATVDSSDCGAVYKESAPKVNACKKPGEWQTMSIDFRAPRFDATGKKTANAKFVKVVLNGQTVQENFEIEHGTNVGRNAKEQPQEAIYIQGDHGPVAFRNLRVTPL